MSAFPDREREYVIGKSKGLVRIGMQYAFAGDLLYNLKWVDMIMNIPANVRNFVCLVIDNNSIYFTAAFRNCVAHSVRRCKQLYRRDIDGYWYEYSDGEYYNMMSLMDAIPEYRTS